MAGSGDEDHASGVCRRGFSNLCWGCNHEIDPETCQCGSSLESHAWDASHGFYEYGCVCYLKVAACDPRDRGNCTTESAPRSG